MIVSAQGRVVSMVHTHVERLKRLLRSSEDRRADAEAKLAHTLADAEAKLAHALADAAAKQRESDQNLSDAEGRIADAEVKLVERERVIASLQLSKATLEDTLNQSIQETDFGKQARQACEEEITLLRHRSGDILASLGKLEAEKVARKQHEYKSKNSVLRSFKWKEKDIDPVVLEGAVAFWGATGEKETTGTGNRASKETRKAILKAIIKDGFGGTLQAELEKDGVKKNDLMCLNLRSCPTWKANLTQKH